MTANATETNNHLATLLDRFGACEEAKAWAAGYDSPLAAWEACPKPEWLLWALAELKILDDRRGRLFACACARQVWSLLTEDSRRAVEVSERFAEGKATQEELEDAWAAAWAVAGGADAFAAAEAEAGGINAVPVRERERADAVASEGGGDIAWVVAWAAAGARTWAAAWVAAAVAEGDEAGEISRATASAVSIAILWDEAAAAAAQCAKIRELWGDDFRTALAKTVEAKAELFSLKQTQD